MWTKPIPSPAKLNLHLHVGSKRDDGYHTIASLFCLTSLCDFLTVTAKEGDGITVNGLEGLCEKGSDTLSKAYRVWKEMTGYPLCLTVDVEKHIPSRAGLGGGSSNAATLLKFLSSIHPVDPALLMEMALAVGSDVPFFASGERMAWVTGRGEHIKAVNGVRALHACIVMPIFFNIGTGSAFNALDAEGKERHDETEAQVLSALKGDTHAYASFMGNDFLSVVPHREFYRELETLAEASDGFGSLSGSGAAWFFLSEKSEKVTQFQARLGERMEGKIQSWVVDI